MPAMDAYDTRIHGASRGRKTYIETVILTGNGSFGALNRGVPDIRALDPLTS
jgi:hypothetical protein